MEITSPLVSLHVPAPGLGTPGDGSMTHRWRGAQSPTSDQCQSEKAAQYRDNGLDRTSVKCYFIPLRLRR